MPQIEIAGIEIFNIGQSRIIQQRRVQLSGSNINCINMLCATFQPFRKTVTSSSPAAVKVALTGWKPTWNDLRK